MSLLKMDERVNKTFSAIDNESRTDFTYNIWHHPKGVWLQNFMKPLAIKIIDMIHRRIRGQYDIDAYRFDDVRLQSIRMYMDEFTKKNFVTTDCGNRRISKPAMQLIDIGLFLLKEDIYYRARFFKLMRELGFEILLSDVEKSNLEKWT